jgi:hypothetical protein
MPLSVHNSGMNESGSSGQILSVIYYTLANISNFLSSLILVSGFRSSSNLIPTEGVDIECQGIFLQDFHRLLHFFLDHGVWRAI